MCVFELVNAMGGVLEWDGMEWNGMGCGDEDMGYGNMGYGAWGIGLLRYGHFLRLYMILMTMMERARLGWDRKRG